MAIPVSHNAASYQATLGGAWPPTQTPWNAPWSALTPAESELAKGPQLSHPRRTRHESAEAHDRRKTCKSQYHKMKKLLALVLQDLGIYIYHKLSDKVTMAPSTKLV